jgi:hypothetical protein
MDLAAFLTQAYMDSTEENPNPQLYYIQKMKGDLKKDIESMDRAPMTLQVMQQRYEILDKQLKDSADYIKSGNVDPKVLFQKQSKIRNTVGALRHDHYEVQEALDDPDHRDHEEYSRIFGKYDNKKFETVDPVNSENILKMSGETKTAAKWIEEVYKDMGSPASVNEERVALILAARQLGNAVYDDPKNIKNTRLSESELRNHANKLMATQQFKDYYATVKDLDFKKTVKHGHGGYLEKTFENFLVQRDQSSPVTEQMEFDAKGRYKKAIDAANPGRDVSRYYDYKNYGDFFDRNKGNIVTSKVVHAARMAAADAMHREDPNAPFDKKALDAKARNFMKQPAFKLMMAMPGKADMIANGDAPGFAMSVKEMSDSCRSMLDKDGKFAHLGQSSISMDRLQKRVEENPDLKPVVDSVNALKEGKKSPEDVIKTLNTIMDYQEKHINDGIGPQGKDLNDSLRLLHELTKGTEMNGVVQTQIDKVNQARNLQEGNRGFLTKEFIGQEGREAEAAAKKEIGNNDLNKEMGPVRQPGA